MEVILLERVAKLGHIGQVVNVKPGYARNFLLPRSKALRATEANKARFEGMKAQLEARNLEQKNEAASIGAKLDGTSYTLIRQAGESGQLYGSVSAKDIADLITAGGFSIGKSQINITSPIKTIGIHTVPVHLHAEVDANITINIARTAAEAEKQTKGEDLTVTEELAKFETFNPDDME